VFVGNPPFAGNNTLVQGYPEGILDWFKQLHAESGGQCDLVAHFFRRSFDLLQRGGALGLIATNTIAQGDTRSSGLRFICNESGKIYSAITRLRWPGVASVVVSVVHIHKLDYGGDKFLDGRKVPQITAYLLEKGSHDNPQRLAANTDLCFSGYKLDGVGFTFEDSEKADVETIGTPTPLFILEKILQENPGSGDVVRHCIGGDEVNSDPMQIPRRYVIDLEDREEAECRSTWPELMEIIEKKVKPQRLAQKREIRSQYWWRFGEVSPRLRQALQGRKEVLFHAFTSKYLQFAVLKSDIVFTAPHIIFIFPRNLISLLQARIHEIWTRFAASSLGDTIRYSLTDCFETFPFPASVLDSIANDPAHEDTRHSLEAIGERYHQFRSELMIRNNEGLTSTYNRFHDPAETSPDLLKLRDLHTEMDQAVLKAYGWCDVLQLGPGNSPCGFGLDYLDVEEDAQLPDELQERIDSGELFFWDANDALDFQGQLQAYGAITGRRKLPWRYRWPDAVRDDVLARLLALNAERYQEEVDQGLHGGGRGRGGGGSSGGSGTGRRRGRPPKTPPTGSDQIGLSL